jgi:hypothetical protein
MHDAERFVRQWRHSLAPLSWSTRMSVVSVWFASADRPRAEA